MIAMPPKFLFVACMCMCVSGMIYCSVHDAGIKLQFPFHPSLVILKCGLYYRTVKKTGQGNSNVDPSQRV